MEFEYVDLIDDTRIKTVLFVKWKVMKWSYPALM